MTGPTRRNLASLVDEIDDLHRHWPKYAPDAATWTSQS